MILKSETELAAATAPKPASGATVMAAIVKADSSVFIAGAFIVLCAVTRKSTTKLSERGANRERWHLYRY